MVKLTLVYKTYTVTCPGTMYRYLVRQRSTILPGNTWLPSNVTDLKF